MAVLWMSSRTVVLLLSVVKSERNLRALYLTVAGPPSSASRMSFILKSGVQASAEAMNYTTMLASLPNPPSSPSNLPSCPSPPHPPLLYNPSASRSRHTPSGGDFI